MAEVRLNEDTGMFEAVIDDQSVDNVTDPGQAEDILEEDEDNVLENQEDILDYMGDAPMEVTPETEAAPLPVFDDYSVSPLSAAASSTSFTPQSWQINLASGRSFGEHYLMYADRFSSGSYNTYWRYHLVLGDDISYENDNYAFSDCDLYTYYSVDSTVYYSRETASGALSGASQVVYSDLYFDYVGVDPAARAAPYITYVLLFMIILFLIVRGKR